MLRWVSILWRGRVPSVGQQAAAWAVLRASDPVGGFCLVLPGPGPVRSAAHVALTKLSLPLTLPLAALGRTSQGSRPFWKGGSITPTPTPCARAPHPKGEG